MKTPPRPATLSLPWKIVTWVAIFLFAGLVGSCLIVLAIWPGEVKLVAPLFCSDAQPDAFVVSDTYSPQPGETTTNYTLYCMGPRGDATDKGFFLPFLAVSALNGFVIVGTLLVLSVLGGWRRRRKTPPAADASDLSDMSRVSDGSAITRMPGSTAGPFVD